MSLKRVMVDGNSGTDHSTGPHSRFLTIDKHALWLGGAKCTLPLVCTMTSCRSEVAELLFTNE